MCLIGEREEEREKEGEGGEACNALGASGGTVCRQGQKGIPTHGRHDHGDTKNADTKSAARTNQECSQESSQESSQEQPGEQPGAAKSSQEQPGEQPEAARSNQEQPGVLHNSNAQHLDAQSRSLPNAMSRITQPVATVSALPTNWEESWSANERKHYYHNRMTGVTQWSHPVSMNVSSASSAPAVQLDEVVEC